MSSRHSLGIHGPCQVRTVGRGSFGEALLVKHRSTGQLSVLKRVRLEAWLEISKSGPLVVTCSQINHD